MSRVYDALFGGGTRSLENPAAGLTGSNLVKAMQGAASDAGIYVTPETAMRFSTVYRCVGLIAGTIAAMPLHTYRRRQGARIPYDSPLLTDPHPDKTPFEFWEYMLTSDLMRGNACSWKAYDASGRVAQLWPLHPGNVEIHAAKPTTTNPWGKVFEIQDPPSGSQRSFTRHEVFHIPALSLDGVKGLSPIEHVARQSVGIGLAAERFGARMFGRGALIQGVIESVKKFTNEEDVRRLQRRWRDRTSGPDNQWEIPVLDDGATFRPIGLPPDQAQYLETRKFQVDDVARIFGVPPHLVGNVEKSTSWGTGIEQQNIGLAIYTLNAWTTRIEQRITKELLPAGAYAKFSMQALLRGDARARAEFYAKLRQSGGMTGDEIRSREDLPPMPGAGDLWRPQNMTSVDPNRPPQFEQQEDDDAEDE